MKSETVDIVFPEGEGTVEGIERRMATVEMSEYAGADAPMTENTSVNMDEVRRLMMERVASSDEHFCRLRQRDETDLTIADRISVAEKLLARNPGEFLTRFGSLLTAKDLEYFIPLSNSDYVVKFRINEIHQRLTAGSASHTVVKNRRYEAMCRLESNGEYFSDEEMKMRDPLLYEQMIGQYLTAEDAAAMIDSADFNQQEPKLSGLLLRHLQAMQNNELYERQKDMEESQMEEEEEEEEEEEDSEDEIDDSPSGNAVSRETQCLTSSEKAVLRTEFIEIMKQRFLSGEDKEFDYSEVDNNTDYDRIDQINRDAEEKYFDDDESVSSDVPPSSADYDY